MKGLVLVLALLLPPRAGQARLIWQGSTHRLFASLTFDAGADRGYAAAILRTLERDHVRATFGLTGAWAHANPDLVRRMARDGDTFINHTYDHRSFTGLATATAPLTTAQRAWEITQAETIIKRISGRHARPYFRPPFGDYDAQLLAQAKSLGYRDVVMWTIDSLGWDHLPAPAILQRCLTLLRPGAILLMHVGSQSQDALALPALIGRLRGRHYRLVTIPQLLAAH
jgi:peptidoglycan/xylan/chitin deacetylase (PgdA/CDA1 family)